MAVHINVGMRILKENSLGALHFDKQNEGGVRSTLLLLRNEGNTSISVFVMSCVIFGKFMSGIVVKSYNG